MAKSVNRSTHVLNTLKNSLSNPPTLNQNTFIGRILSANYDKGIVQYTRVLTPGLDISEGKAKLPVFNYGVGADKKIYGKFPSVTYNSLVLLIRTQGPTSIPYVVALYPDNQDGMKELSPISDMDDEDNIVKEVYPSGQTYSTYSTGNTLRTFNGWSFFYVWLNKSEDANSESGNFDDLLYDDYGLPVMHGFYKRGNTKKYKLHDQAQNMALVHQSYSDIDTHRTAIMLNKFGSFESYFIDHSGQSNYGLLARADIYDGFSIRRVQDYKSDQDSVDNDSDVDSQFDNSSNYSEINIDESDNINLTRVDNSSTKGVEVTAEGTYIDGVLVASQTGLQTVSDELKSLQSSFTTLDDQISGLGTDFFNKLQTDVLNLQNTYASLNSDISSMQTTVSSVSSSITTIENNIKDITDWESNMNTTVSGIDTKISDITDKVNSNSSRITTIENRMPSGTDKLVPVSTLNDYSTTNINDGKYVAKADYDALQMRVANLEAEIANMTTTTTTTKKS